MSKIIILSITSFIATNMDDMVINAFFFSSVNSEKDIRRIVFGKYIGTGILILLSMAAAFGLGFVTGKYVSYLGLIPIALGIAEIIRNRKCADGYGEKAKDKGSGKLVLTVAAVTIANGADNMGVYIPLFAGFSLYEYSVFLCVFALLTAFWCFMGYKAAKIPAFKDAMRKYKRVIVPAVYILLGLYILIC